MSTDGASPVGSAAAALTAAGVAMTTAADAALSAATGGATSVGARAAAVGTAIDSATDAGVATALPALPALPAPACCHSHRPATTATTASTPASTTPASSAMRDADERDDAPAAACAAAPGVGGRCAVISSGSVIAMSISTAGRYSAVTAELESGPTRACAVTLAAAAGCGMNCVAPSPMSKSKSKSTRPPPAFGGSTLVRSQCNGADSAGRRTGGRARPSSTSRNSATLCGRSVGRGQSIQSMVCRKLWLQPGRLSGVRLDASSCTARAVAGGGGRPSSR